LYLEKQKGKDHVADLGVDGKIMLNQCKTIVLEGVV
jgi:hypothetical protein